MTTSTKLQNALLRKNGEFIVKDQIIFQYPKAITTQQVKAQVNYLLGKRALKANVEVKLLDKNKHIFLIAGPGVHNWGDEVATGKLGNRKPIPPPPPPVIPSFVYRNTVIINGTGIKSLVDLKSNSFKR